MEKLTFLLIQRDINIAHTLKSGLTTMINSRNIITIGIAQTLFECSMYIFVLLYTPAIENSIESEIGAAVKNIPLGYLFSTMMLAVMIGSLTFQVFEIQAKTGPRFYLKFTEDKLLTLALGLACFAFILMSSSGDSSVKITALDFAFTDFMSRQRDC